MQMRTVLEAMVRITLYLCSYCSVQSNKHCGVISQRIFKNKISLERSCDDLNEMGFIFVIELVVVEVWAFETKKILEWNISLQRVNCT